MSIHEITFLNNTAFLIENEKLKVTVLPKEGSNLISIFDKKKKCELLRVPDTREEYDRRRMLYGTPVLFPPNRIEDAIFQFDNRTYELEMNRPKENVHIHGWVHNKEWSVHRIDSEKGELVTRIHSTDHPDILEQFPHEFILEMTIQLTEKTVKQSLKIINKSNNEMPVGIGYHTTFNFPSESSKLSIDVTNYWELNKRNLPTGRLLGVSNQRELKTGVILKGHALDDIYPMTNNRQAIIEHPSYGLKLTYEAITGFKHWVLFTGDGQSDLLAIEPYSWVTNAPNLSLSEDVTGMDSLKPNQEKEYITLLYIEHI